MSSFFCSYQKNILAIQTIMTVYNDIKQVIGKLSGKRAKTAVFDVLFPVTSLTSSTSSDYHTLCYHNNDININRGWITDDMLREGVPVNMCFLPITFTQFYLYLRIFDKLILPKKRQ